MNKEIIKENIELYEEKKEQIKKDQWGWYGGLFHFKCINCGGYCSRGEFWFWDSDPEKVKCRECQNKRSEIKN